MLDITGATTATWTAAVDTVAVEEGGGAVVEEVETGGACEGAEGVILTIATMITTTSTIRWQHNITYSQHEGVILITSSHHLYIITTPLSSHLYHPLTIITVTTLNMVE